MRRHIILEMAAATREQDMWERRFRVLYAQHPIWRTVDNDGSWGLRDFLNYAGEVCGFSALAAATREGGDAKQAPCEASQSGGSASERNAQPPSWDISND